ncbi:hypothetical protein B0J15DRAFT_503625 [Fusarium solani]|uniref:Uncharacterized protein n=1 Tax=Fusarium solani TaxID=169388 RepID=A0A9P9GE22_FUSSL|nr:uncharacterized protein B0J15DRAFT_503625 [Fusarium solani]KAH7237346.1 hypothetical protein B0J15DRAFT_503625 [Fusarium solani]
MPLIKRSPIRPPPRPGPEEDSDDTSSYTSETDVRAAFVEDAEIYDSDIAARGPRQTRLASSRPESHNGQPLVSNNANRHNRLHEPQRGSRSSQRFQPRQERIQEHPPNHYPDPRIPYAATGLEEDFSPRRVNSYGAYGRQRMASSANPAAYNPGMHGSYPAGSQPFTQSGHFHHLTSPPPPPTEVQTPTPRTDANITRLEAELAELRAREEERRVREERERFENGVREASKAEIQQAKEQLERTRQKVSEEIEQARLQGEQDALIKFEKERHAEREEQRQLNELRREIETEVRAELEAEREAEMAEREERERLTQEFERKAMDLMLEKLEEALSLSKEKFLQDTEMDKGLLLTAVQTSIKSHLRQSLVVSPPREENDHVSSFVSEPRLKPRSPSPPHQMECTSVPDTTCSRSQSSSSQGGSQMDCAEPPPAVPDAPRGACDSVEDEEGMTDHLGYTSGDWGFLPGYQSFQHPPRRHGGRDMEDDYRNHGKLPFKALVDHVTEAVMDRLNMEPNRYAPRHMTPFGQGHPPYYPTRRQTPESDDYSGFHGWKRHYGDAAAVYDGGRFQHEEPDHIPRPYEPPRLRRIPIEAIQNVPSPSSGASLDPLPSPTVEESHTSAEDPVQAQPSARRKLLEASNSVERGTDTESYSDSESIAGSDSTVFHEAPESMTEYSMNGDSAVGQDNPKDSPGGWERQESCISQLQ